MSYDKKGGLVGPNASPAVITTDFAGNVIVDMVNESQGRALTLTSDITKGVMERLDETLWIEGNFSVGYGRELSENSGDTFTLQFNPLEVEQALRIEASELDLKTNTWFPGLLAAEPDTLACFPYTQHFLSDSPGHSSDITNKAELEAAIANLDFSTIPSYSMKSMQKMFMYSSLVTMFIILSLTIALILK